MEKYEILIDGSPMLKVFDLDKPTQYDAPCVFTDKGALGKMLKQIRRVYPKATVTVKQIIERPKRAKNVR
jgi:hypothetical protein